MRRQVRIRYRHWLFHVPPLRSYRGICLGRTICFKEGEESITPVLLRHEMTHQAQMEKHGTLRFYLIYLKDYFLNLVRYRSHWQAYRNIPFEVEAYASEKKNSHGEDHGIGNEADKG